MLTFVPMTPVSFMDYRTYAIEEWAKFQVDGGGTCDLDNARPRMQNLFDEMLPNGLDTNQGNQLIDLYLTPSSDQSLSTNTPEKIGFLWYQIKDTVVLLQDFEIYLQYRRQGYGEQALRHMMEKVANTAPNRTIKLEVHAHNKAALKLYSKVGFNPYKTIMVFQC